jgi:hypothetical protein
MTNKSELATTGQGPSSINPFQRSNQPAHINAGTIAIEESRAIAEAQGKLIIAKRFPRDEYAAFERVLNSCKRRSLAEAAVYAYPRAGQTISGPSIRLAEELARAWGNIDYGIRELSQRDGESEMESYCWDLETNVYSSQKFTIKHERHTRTGVSALKDPRDIYELTANQAARRLRARILAVLPPDLVEKALDECSKTLSGNNDEPIQERVKKMLSAFAKLGISSKLIESRVKKPLTEILPDDLAELIQIHNSVRDGMSKASEWFSSAGEEQPTSANVQSVNDKLAKLKEEEAAKAKKVTPPVTVKKTEPKAEPSPEPEPSNEVKPSPEAIAQPIDAQASDQDEELM